MAAKRTKAELKAYYLAKAAEVDAAEVKGNTSKIERLAEEIKTINERIDALKTKRQSKIDEQDRLQRDIDEQLASASTADDSAVA